MVMLAEKMRQKLLSGTNSQTGSASNDEEMGSKQEMQDWMLSVGIISPVTKESAGALYHQQLSRQVVYTPFSLFVDNHFAQTLPVKAKDNAVIKDIVPLNAVG